MGGRVHLQSDHHPDVSWLALHTDGTATLAFAELIIEGYGDVMRKLLAGPSGDEAAFHRALLTDFNRFRLLCAHRTGRMGVRGLVELTEGLLSRTIRGFRPRGNTYLGRPIMVTLNDYSVRLPATSDDCRARGSRPVASFRMVRAVCSTCPGAPSDRDRLCDDDPQGPGLEFEHAVVVLPNRPARFSPASWSTRVTRQESRLGRWKCGGLGRCQPTASGPRQRLAERGGQAPDGYSIFWRTQLPTIRLRSASTQLPWPSTRRPAQSRCGR